MIQPLHRTHRTILLTLVLLVGASFPAHARDTGAVFRDACRAEIQGDHASALALYRQAADAGLREAMFALGRYHRDGLGTTADAQAAFEWFRKAAERGHPVARYELGLAYRDGRGTDEDLDLAREWLEAAALRHGRAAFALFQIEDDPQEQGLWLRRAAELGHRRAMSDLSRAYARGEHGLALSLARSHHWRERAAAIDHEEPRQ